MYEKHINQEETVSITRWHTLSTQRGKNDVGLVGKRK